MLNIYNQQNSEPVAPLKSTVAPKTDYHKYQDPTGEFDTKELQYSLWYMKHKVLIYRLGIFSLILIIVFLFLLSGVLWTFYVAGIPAATELERVSTQAPNYTTVAERQKAIPLQVTQTSIFSGGVNKYDAVSEITNENIRFIARFVYSYIVGNQKTTPQNAVVLPGQSTLIANLGLTDAPSNATLEIDGLQWQRLSNHTLPDPKTYQADRLQFVVNNFVFTNVYSQGDLKVNRLTFNLTNASAYSYRQPQFYVGLYSGGGLVGVMPLQFDSFAAGETKAIDLRNFVNNAQVQSVEIFPRIDVYDESVYLPPAS